MKKRSTKTSRRSDRPLYPALIAACGIALIGGLWSLQGAEDYGTDVVEAPKWREVASVDVDELEPQLWEDPVELGWRPGPTMSSTLEMRQVRESDGDDGGAVVRLEIDCDESIDGDEGELVVERTLAARAVDVRRGGQPLNLDLDGQVAAAIDGARYEFDIDERGVAGEIRWDRQHHPGLEPTAQLVASVQQLLVPRFPAEPVLVGESWSYEIPFPPSMLEDSEWTVEGGAEVDNQLSGVFLDDQDPVAAISREFSAEIREISGENSRSVEVTGRGTAYFDLNDGRLVASELRTQQVVANADDEADPDDADPGEPTFIEARWIGE